MPNVGRMNALSFFPVAMLNTSVFAFMNFMQPYILSEHLGIARGIQGTVVGSISTMQELIILSLTALMGALADKLGRQPVFSLGLLLMSVAYFCFPLATELYHLYLIRVLFAIGVSAASTVLIIYTGDYPQEKSRAKWNGFMGLFQGLGITITSLFLTKMPAIFQEKGFDAIQSGTYTLWIGTFICLTAAILVATMLKPGSRQSKPSRSSLKDLFRDGLFAAKSDSRIRLAFVASAAARGDIFVVGIFTFLWMSNFALDNGLSINQGYARGAFVIPIIAGTVLITSPIFGFIMDRIDRIYGVMIAFSLSTIGYTMMGLVNDPMSNTIIPIAIILGAGEGACIISSTTLIGKTAPITIRGTVFGAFAMCGAIGQIIAGGVGGILFDYIYTGPFLLMGGMNFLVLLMAIYTWLSRKKASNSS
ncbi:MAG: MFS transporter [Gammaproteobacteria bacterium]|nr:MFS transporter [Gammaproteobacteria bacterium]MBT5216633.1 MFS transporter [Gammaproteobacteria bacterium]MBT6073471.1 MFS transporter [Gammaproteobacteria bacterium]